MGTTSTAPPPFEPATQAPTIYTGTNCHHGMMTPTSWGGTPDILMSAIWWKPFDLQHPRMSLPNKWGVVKRLRLRRKTTVVAAEPMPAAVAAEPMPAAIARRLGEDKCPACTGETPGCKNCRGCLKCRGLRKGCAQCRKWAEQGLHNYHFFNDVEVVRGDALTRLM